MAEEKKKQETTDERVGKDERYMEGNYDNRGNIVKRYKQKRDDEYRSVQIAEEIKASQEAVYERETERLSYEEKAEGDAFVQLMRDYIEEDKYQQYLVDGAVLRCNQATTDDFDYAGGTVVLENKADEVCDIILDVHENPIYEDPESMMINNKIYATVKDTIQGLNINPPRCNCRLAADRIAENERIRGDADHNKNGVCRHLMQLNDTWDNFRVEGTEYLKRDNAIMVFDNGEDGQAVQVGTYIEHTNIEGITMTSVLFCKHGGLIMPVTSGQTVTIKADAINILRNYLAVGEFDDNEVEKALEYLAKLSQYKLLEYKSVLGKDYNEYDTYILGWSEYYHEVFDIEIDPNYIKAQCYKESRIGKGANEAPAANLYRDIMQALDVRNYNIYMYIGISPNNFKILTSDKNYITGSEIWSLNLGKLGYSEPEAGKYDNDLKVRCGGIINTLFNTEIDGSGTNYDEESNAMYYYQLETVTPIMSIGVGLDKMQGLLKKYSGNYYEALKDYNGSEDKEQYAKDIITWAETEGDCLQME